MSAHSDVHNQADIRPATHVSPEEFAELSGLSSATVRRYLADGRLPKSQPGGRRCRVLIPVSALNPFAASAKSGVEEDANGNQDVAAPASPTSADSTSPLSRRGPPPRWLRRG